jgi:hypothetical protein
MPPAANPQKIRYAGTDSCRRLYLCYHWSRPACCNDVELVRLLAHTLEGLLTGQNQVDDS